jgi:dTDP-4-dehydrorhamnose 3,5-epimerase
VRVIPTELPGVVIVEPDVFRDVRGFFLEVYHADKYRAHGITGPFVQDNHSRSVARTVRGLHLQTRRPQGKLIRVVHGEILDVAVDVRVGSPAFGKWVGMRLSADNCRQCYIPQGFAHGFSVLSESAEIEYKCTDFYDPAGELGVAWNDPQIGIKWQVEEPILSDRDRLHRRLADLSDLLPRYTPTLL